MPDYSGQHVVVTGGAGALGAAVLKALVDCGASCHVPYLTAHGQLESQSQVRFTPGVDLRSEKAVVEYYASLPPIRASIHLAGGFAMKDVVSTSQAEFEDQFAMNATTAFLCCREAIRNMRNGAGGGRIVNVAARPALVPTGGMTAYAVSKAAVASLTACLAEEVKRDGILVNAVAPSIIDTPMNRQAMPKADFSTWPKPEEIAGTILYLASTENALTSGTVVPVYGRA